MLKSLRKFYVGLLLERNGEDISTNKPEALCELLWNDDCTH